jgi:GAF domain-containing protein
MRNQPVDALTERDAALRSAERENETLYAVIKTVSSSLDLDRVLRGIVDIATDATACHAAFIYFAEGDRLVLRAASPSYGHLLGRVQMGVDEGLAGWVARTKTPEFIPDAAMEDPRMKYVPELEEERFQSMVAVPILDKAEEVIGVAVLHTAAPREFEEGVLNFLVHTASLVAGAIENAQLYEETRRRVGALTTLTELSQAIAAATSREELYEAVTRGARALLEADACRIFRLDEEADELVLAEADPGTSAEFSHPGGTRMLLDLTQRANGGGPTGDAAAALWPDGEAGAVLTAPLVVGKEHLGIVCCRSRDRDFGAEDQELLRALANQTAVGLKKTELIERLTAENTVKDMFDALATGSVEAAEAKAAEAGCDLTRSHLFAHVERAQNGAGWDGLPSQIEAQLRKLGGRALVDVRPDRLRILAPVGDTPGAVESVRTACDDLGRESGAVIGLSDVGSDARSARRRIREAADAARIGRSLAPDGGAVSYEQLGAYRYLVHLELDDAPRDHYRASVERLVEYDRKRGSHLVETLEQYLADRGSVTTSARALYVHPNTVRQRLERIERVAELDLSDADLLSLELALKLVRLHRVREGADLG